MLDTMMVLPTVCRIHVQLKNAESLVPCRQEV